MYTLSATAEKFCNTCSEAERVIGRKGVLLLLTGTLVVADGNNGAESDLL